MEGNNMESKKIFNQFHDIPEVSENVNLDDIIYNSGK